MYGINLIITTIMTIIFMLSVDVELTFYSLIPLPFLSLSIYIISKKIEKKSMALQEGLSDLAIHVQEGISGIRLIKAFAKEVYHSKEFKIKSKAYKNRALDLTKNNAYFHPLMIAFVGISIVMVLMIGGFQVLAGKITLGNIAEFVMYITRLTWPMTAIGWVTSIIQRAEASQNRINELLEHKNEIVDGEYDVKTFGKKITFKSVYFAYPDEPQKWVLEDLNLIIEKGKSLGIIGPIGSGKTTILQLLMRCYDVSSGGIFLDEHNIKDLKVSSLRKLIGYVPQDVFLFSDTIENNILFGLENKENANLENAIFIANLDQAISLFPQGLKSMLGERGINLSGGQKQRTAIARALIREPEILLLDDCLSAVDTHTEHQILQRLKEVLKGKTTIITSHRVSAVKLADQIAVLNEGKIVEMGSHEELLKLNGKYKAIYDKQTTIETEVIINK
jgi:ATP-binding cassette subfamily B protein